MFFFVDVALWFNQYVNPIALNAIGWKYYIVYCVWIAFELAVVWKFFIETKNTPLEEIAKYFDGDRALVGGDASTAKARHLMGEDEAAENVGEKEAIPQTAAVHNGHPSRG